MPSESIFYQNEPTGTEYSGADFDRKMIEMHYRPEVLPGMTRALLMSRLL